MASEKSDVPERKQQAFESPKPTDTNASFSSAEKHSRNASIVSSENEEYESEPASVSDFVAKKKRRMNFKDGKTCHPKSNAPSRELRELAKKQLELEKNLKIEGMPEPPKIRKRRMSVGSNTARERDMVFKRKRLYSLDLRPKKDHMPQWGMMGGNATDPLNLNGLASSEEGRLLNLRTPENSPLPTPDFRKIVYVKVPPNIEDPLNLEGKHDQRVIDMLLNTTRKKRHRSRKNKDNVNHSKEENPEANNVCVEHSESDTNKEPENEKPKPSDDSGSVLKVENQPTTTRSRSISMSPERKVKRQLSGGKGGKIVPDVPKKFPENPKFTQGNYNRYYGYRNQDHVPDPRLRYFNLQWFENKDVLDIGCNVGHVTLALADQFSPRKILGMDVDGKLIGAARQNIRHLLSQRRKDSSKYPSVFEATRGPLEAHPLTGSSNKFPNNVLFMQGNYVPGSEDILQMQKEEYDTILALSITKWIHLNNGDRGLKLFFQKIHKQLRPGGRLILEPQPWSTYRKRAKLSPELFKNYSQIKLKPEGFKNYLLSIGFVKCEVIGVPVTKAKGFRRPLILFTKADPHCPALSQPQNPTGSDFRPFAEYLSGDYMQCAGMRTGAYADRLYDHIAYRSSEPGRSLSVPSPMNNSYSQSSPMVVPFPYSCSHASTSTRKTDSEISPSSSFSGHGSQIQSGSESVWSHSSSGSSHCSSFTSVSSSNSPVVGNGEVMEEDVWLEQDNPALAMLNNGNGDPDQEVNIAVIENGAFIPNGHLSSGDDDEAGGGIAANGNPNFSSSSSSNGGSSVAASEELNNNGAMAPQVNGDHNDVWAAAANESHSSEVDVVNASNEEG